MNTAIVTFIRAYNYGAVLQCYALHKTLNDLGIDNEVLDYYPQYFKDLYNLEYLGKMRYFPYRPIKNWLKYTPLLWTLQKRNTGFSRFINKNIKLSKQQFVTSAELDGGSLHYDAYITGSDQVWSDSCARFDPTFFLDFDAAKHAKKLSYAASFGMTQIPPTLTDEYLRRLKKIDRFSVREESGVKIIRDLLNIEAEICCDPTLLLDKKHWEKVFPEQKRIKKPYIFLYYVNDPYAVLPLASELATIKKLDVYSATSIPSYENLIGTPFKAAHFKHIGSAAPEHFLSLFAGAEYIITDSFHGTVFSTIFHKKFLTVTELPCGKINHRALSLLKWTNLENHAFPTHIEAIDISPNWEAVDHALKVLRDSSISYLKSLQKS